MFARKRNSTLVICVTTFAVYLADGLTPAMAQQEAAEAAKLVASDAEGGDYFGHWVAISADRGVVGSVHDDDAGSSSGSAYVYRYDVGTGTWIEEVKLTGSDGAERDNFGQSVSIDGDVAVIGASGHDDAASDAGAAYVYRYDASNDAWIEEAKLTASDAEAGDGFGISVSISGDVAVIGAWYDDDLGPNSGSAYVFRYNGSEWVEEDKFTGGTYTFGYYVCVHGDVAVISSHWDDDLGGNSGSAYVYRFNGSIWENEQELLASDGAAGDHFGISVSVRDDVALIGAYHDDDNGANSGSAYVFRYDGDAWIEEEKLIASDGAAYDEFGISVSITGDLALVSAHLDDDLGPSAGAAYVYRHDAGSGTWIEKAKLSAADGETSDWFSWRLCIDGNSAVMGARQNSDAGPRSGSAYVFELCVGDLDRNGQVDLADLARLLANLGTPSEATYYHGDLDSDGDVDLADLAELLAHYRESCP